MLNPVQEYAKARSMPIPALVAVLQGKSDMVSLGVAHAALKEKTEAEIARKGANAAMMAQAPKQIERDLAIARGLAAMPTDVDVPMGGIVGNEGQMTQAGAGGGSVVAFSNGGQSALDDERMRAERIRAARPGPGVSFSQAFPNQAAPAARGFTDYLKSGARSLFGRVLPVTSAITATDDLNAGETAQLDMYRTLLGLGYSENDIAQMPPEIRNQIMAGLKQSGAAQQPAQPPAAPPPSERPPADEEGGLGSLQARGASYEDRMADAEKMARKGVTTEAPKTAKQFMEERDTILKEAGYDFDLVKKQIEEARKEKEELKGDKKEAMNLRLIEAGLGILGGESPYAFVNIGKGATPALQGLAKDIKEIKKETKAYDKEIRQLNAMQNEITAGRATYGLEALNKQQERVARREESIQRSRDSIFTTMVGKDTQLSVAGMQAAALKTERDLARKDARAKTALDAAEQAARDIMDPTERAKAVKTYFREFYSAAYGNNAGAAPAPRASGKVVNGVYVPAGQ